MAADVETAAEQTEALFQWQPPVLRNPALALAEQVRRGPRPEATWPSGSSRTNRDPAASWPAACGRNLLRDAWPAIWQDVAFQAYRSRIERPTHCLTCPGLAICAGPLPSRAVRAGPRTKKKYTIFQIALSDLEDRWTSWLWPDASSGAPYMANRLTTHRQRLGLRASRRLRWRCCWSAWPALVGPAPAQDYYFAVPNLQLQVFIEADGTAWAGLRHHLREPAWRTRHRYRGYRSAHGRLQHRQHGCVHRRC